MTPKKLTCPECWREFEPVQANQVWCSRTCRDRARRRRKQLASCR